MPKRILIIGAVALGPKAASRCKRLMPEAEVTLIDQAERISYGGCGIPFFVSGEVSRVEELLETPYHTVRDPAFFASHKGIRVLINTRALSIDRIAKTVLTENLLTGEKQHLPYDELVLATGASPNILPIPGVELQGVRSCVNLDDAEFIKHSIQRGQVNHALIIGAGFIGLEMAVALADMWGIPVSVLEASGQVLPNFVSPTLSRMAVQDLEAHGVKVYLNEKALRLEGQNGSVTQVCTEQRVIAAELVIMAAGVRPNSALARDAGLAVNSRGLVEVDAFMRSSDPHIYAGGDVAAVKNLITQKPAWYPLGSMANRQGRVIGTNLAGGQASFPGAVGAWGIKLFEVSFAGAGLTLETASREGFDAVPVYVEQLDRAHFYPEKELMGLELLVGRSTRRILGIQGVCSNGDALLARINPVVPLLARGAELDELSNLEVVYAPPFASAMDIINAVANVADNILAGRLAPLSLAEFEGLWAERDNNRVHIIDTRERKDAAFLAEKYPGFWQSIPQNELLARLDEIPSDKPLILVCNTGLRSYEAQLNLVSAGREGMHSLLGGLAAARRFGIPL